MGKRPRRVDLAQVNRAVARLDLPEAIWKTAPWQPRLLVATGRRHHHPDGAGTGARDGVDTQLGRTVVARTLVAEPDEQCVLWDVDSRVGVDKPWGVPADRVAAVTAAAAAR